jgi:hypothetical protein
MKIQIITIGITAFLLIFGICGCISDKTNHEGNKIESVTFQVIWNNLNKTENITIKNVTVPLNESEAIKIYLEIIGEKPGDIEIIEKTDFGWSVYYGNPVYGFGADIYEVNRTVDVYGGY